MAAIIAVNAIESILSPGSESADSNPDLNIRVMIGLRLRPRTDTVRSPVNCSGPISDMRMTYARETVACLSISKRSANL